MHHARPRRFLSLASVMAGADFRLRYAGSALGYFWSLSKPMLLFGVLYVVFTHFLRFGAGIPNYPAMLLLGIVLWTFFVETTSGSVTILVARGDLIRKLPFPKVVLPVSISMTALLTLALNLVAVIVFLVAGGIRPTMSWLVFPLLVVELYVFALGMSLLLSAAFVRMRDIGQVWDLGLQFLFYGTPLIYPIAIVPEQYRQLLMLNPIAQIVQQSRVVLIGDNAATHVELDTWAQIVPFVVVVAVVVAGSLYFRVQSPRVAELV